MAAGVILGILMLARHRCIAYSLVVIWAYTGIIIKQNAQEIVHKDIIFTAWAGIILLVLLIITTLLKIPQRSGKYSGSSFRNGIAPSGHFTMSTTDRGPGCGNLRQEFR
ncbi:MAG: hypothetical protein U5N26_03125 [Candidatus Marinimicrobia bacterium]|nr:hypothetical protein [Candidatus Neomarinimicrobiota bacterium]